MIIEDGSEFPKEVWWRVIGKWSLLLFGWLILIVFIILSVFSLLASQRETKTAAESAPSSGHFVWAGDVSVFVQESGPASGQPVLLVHGTGAWSQIWSETSLALADAGFRVVAIDVPPFGYSDKPEGALSYSRQLQAKRILALLDALKIEKAIFVGHSVGARPTVEAALLGPNRVDRLVLVDPALGFQSESNGQPHFQQNDPSWMVKTLFSIKILRNAVLQTYGTNPLTTKFLFSSFVSRTESVTKSRVVMLQKPLVVKNTTNGYGDWLQNLVQSPDTSLGSDFGNFKKLTMPVSIIWGDGDTVTPLWQAKQLQALIPDSHLHVMNDVGHIPYIEDPAKFNTLLLSIIK